MILPHQTTWRHIPEDHTVDTCHNENVIFQMLSSFLIMLFNCLRYLGIIGRIDCKWWIGKDVKEAFVTCFKPAATIFD
jgi:hypothetical protein